ncbi:unnamed protein product [Blepharisma stoltei]|uniref:CRC domain-containing protein n=1 Tax=Blepharisma stoltei TaxID=1481888 RepID=A0AAU9K864_9CILI|nr:unnamed protein product [Blepharisma stoltei]
MERRVDRIIKGDLSPISPFSQFCLTSLPPIGTFSAQVEQQIITEEKEKTTNEQSSTVNTPCGCKRTHCLKLYCECFANNRYCVGCKCHNCHNLPSYDEARQATMKQIVERNPVAFKPENNTSIKVCHCKRSGCVKKYCECYEASKACSPLCKCEGCKNMSTE